MASQLWAAPDFAKITPVKQRQAAFFAYLQPIAEQVNAAILKRREKVIAYYRAWQKNQQVSQSQQQWLQSVAKHYRLSNLKFSQESDWKALLKRVDIVPVSMVLAQAANESAWGTSRFTLLGNNYFGQWCFQNGCGIVPKLRPKGRHYEVQKFSSASASVASYMNNMNTNSHYELFRELREQARKAKLAINGFTMAQGLVHYSERGESYVKSIQAIIKHHKLTQLDIA